MGIQRSCASRNGGQHLCFPGLRAVGSLQDQAGGGLPEDEALMPAVEGTACMSRGRMEAPAAVGSYVKEALQLQRGQISQGTNNHTDIGYAQLNHLRCSKHCRIAAS